MSVDFAALATFVLVTTFTPGPNNITSASLGILQGYRRSLPFLLGISLAFVVTMLLCSLVSSALIAVLPAFEAILRVVGALYILWLAYHTLRATYAFHEQAQEDLGRKGFLQGALLQLLNPKALVYGLTIYGVFLVGISGQVLPLALSAVALAFVTFCAISTWALSGAAIRAYLDRGRVRQIVNTALALLLVYTAVEISGVLELVKAMRA